MDPFQTMPYRVWQKKSAASGGLVNLLGPGGGGTSDAVQYIPQELTESQQMQARKNLGVYWKGETETTIVPQRSVTAAESEGVCGAEFPDLSIDPLKEYVVILNGSRYRVAPYEMQTNYGESVVMLGSKLLDAETMTFAWDYPFVFMIAPWGRLVYVQSAGEYTVSVNEIAVDITPIPPEYLTNARFVVNVTTEDMSNFTADKTMEEIVAAHKAGMTVVAVMVVRTNGTISENVFPFVAYAEQAGSITLCNFTGVSVVNGLVNASGLSINANGVTLESKQLADK